MPTVRRRWQAQEQTIYRDLQRTLRDVGATSLRVTPHNLLAEDDVDAEIVFDRSGRRYIVQCDKWDYYLDNLRACERTVYYLWKALDDYGARRSDERVGADDFQTFFSPFEALPGDGVLRLPSGQRAWWEVLGVEQRTTQTAIRNAYRALARIHHPDRGGDADQFRRIQAAYEEGIASVGGVA